jgi:hypothetical protein
MSVAAGVVPVGGSARAGEIVPMSIVPATADATAIRLSREAM